MSYNAAAGNDVVVSIKNASLQYAEEKGAVYALQDINLDIYKGEFICVLGPSGCGKSTLLNIIAGFHNPTEGTAIMGDTPITGPDWRKGVVFQTPALNPWLDIYSNMAINLKLRNIEQSKIQTVVDKYIELAGIQDFKNQKPYELSGEVKQRVALARVLVNEPNIILMDDTFGKLDRLTRSKLQSFTRGIWQKTGNTIFMITDDVDEALTLATRVIVMSSRPGSIVKEFSTNFTYDIANANNGSVCCSKEHVEIREEILNIINTWN